MNLLEQERKIEASGVRKVFTPFSPIELEDSLFGRQNEVQDLLATINTPGQYALIYGDRGVGKSSLAFVTSKLAEECWNYEVSIRRCDSETSLTQILSDILRAIGLDPNKTTEKSEIAQGGGAKAGIGLFGGDVKSQRVRSSESDSAKDFQSPSWLSQTVKDHRALLIVDELDSIASEEEKRKIAEFVKFLSDARSEFKMLLVGVSSTGRDLVSNHKSVERCINEIVLNPIKISDLRNIITNGASKLALTFDEDVVDDIVDISGGYPHFVHLMALRCAEQAVLSDVNVIRKDMLPSALKRSARFSDGRFKRVYEECIAKNTDVSRKVLLGAALCHHKGFLLGELMEMTVSAVDSSLSKRQIESALRRIVGLDTLDVIARVERGHYRFSDPRMAPYIKMLNGFTFTEESLIVDILRSEYGKRYGANE